MTGEASTFPTLTPELLDDVVQRILDVGSPRRIVLFGSRARGDARQDSDLDLLIIEDSELPRYRRPPRYLRALVGVFPAKAESDRLAARRLLDAGGPFDAVCFHAQQACEKALKAILTCALPLSGLWLARRTRLTAAFAGDMIWT